MRKFIEQQTIVHYWTRKDGNDKISFPSQAVSSDKEAISLAISTCNIRKKNITGIEVYKHVVDFDRLKLAMNEIDLHHGCKCICFKCTGKTDLDPPTSENWINEDGRWYLRVRTVSF
jgi:hypothetical protein